MKPQETVFLVDADAAVCDALKLLLTIVGYNVVSYTSAQAFLSDYSPKQSGCLVLDVIMPGMNGLELEEVLTTKNINIPIIFTTDHGHIPTWMQRIKAGAVDVLQKPIDEDVLIARIEEALEKNAHIREEEEVARKKDIELRFARLTEREQEIMKLVVAGHANKEIARMLGISHRTVEIHRTRIRSKMQAQSLPDLVVMALKCDFLKSA